jgi:hypothetical protein
MFYGQFFFMNRFPPDITEGPEPFDYFSQFLKMEETDSGEQIL